MASRQVNGPEKDWLTLAEVAVYLGVSENTVRNLIKDKKFPRGARIAPSTTRWGWLDVVAFLHLASRLPAGGDDDET